MAEADLAPKFAPFFGMGGIAFASLIPVVMAGILAVYSLVIAVLIAGDLGPPPEQEYSLFNGFMHLAAGMSVGLTGLAAGYAIGVVGDMGVRSYMQQSKVFVGMVLILIFGEVLGLYGYVVIQLVILGNANWVFAASLWD
ncbi:MAG: hypothetical protein Q9164_004361 [Protoblastenia rupestris]